VPTCRNVHQHLPRSQGRASQSSRVDHRAPIPETLPEPHRCRRAPICAPAAPERKDMATVVRHQAQRALRCGSAHCHQAEGKDDPGRRKPCFSRGGFCRPARQINKDRPTIGVAPRPLAPLSCG
jgi:hypothetical protein